MSLFNSFEFADIPEPVYNPPAAKNSVLNTQTASTYKPKKVVEEKAGINLIPSMTIKPDSLVLWNYIDGLNRSGAKMPESNKRDTLGLSKKSAARMYSVITALYKCSKSKSVYQRSTGKYFSFKCNFITLTLPSKQIHTDKEIQKEVFEPFIRKCRLQIAGFMYVYKAEVQDNGNLHYHVNTNVFIHHERLRDLWNGCCERLGYVTRSGIKSPNSTDVKAVKNKTDLAKYMSKYMTKSDRYDRTLKRYFRRYKKKLNMQIDSCTIPKNFFKHIKRKVNIKLWDCSTALKNVKHSVYGLDGAFYDEIDIISKTCRVYAGDHATMFFDVNYHLKELSKIGNLWREMLSKVIEIEKESLKALEID
jgi:hypothetical protein